MKDRLKGGLSTLYLMDSCYGGRNGAGQSLTLICIMKSRENFHSTNFGVSLLLYNKVEGNIHK